MNDNGRRAIVWDIIERIAFRPDSPARWLGVYAKTLHMLWPEGGFWGRFGLNDNIEIPFLMLRCDYQIESVAKYSVSLLQDSPAVRCHWQNHIDPEFLSKGALHSANARYPHDQRAQLQGDIEAVLDGMIFHPRCHTHLEDLGISNVQLDQEKGGLKSHEVRIGGGIENPYVFLFHLRYQFCLVHTNVRRDERQRLIDLFESSIRAAIESPKKTLKNVNAADLFNYKR
ncbi:MAG: hypothetical protein JEZ11_11220 [Desulfobacterales bacterium]|nr:hypothetical protein [Desulfobacterales bacterium]